MLFVLDINQLTMDDSLLQDKEKDGILMFINLLIGKDTKIILRGGHLIIFADSMIFLKLVLK